MSRGVGTIVAAFTYIMGWFFLFLVFFARGSGNALIVSSILLGSGTIALAITSHKD